VGACGQSEFFIASLTTRVRKIPVQGECYIRHFRVDGMVKTFNRIRPRSHPVERAIQLTQIGKLKHEMKFTEVL
jgi:hypothetical protein